LEFPSAEQLLDEVDNHNKAIQESSKSPDDTKSEIIVVKSFLTSRLHELQVKSMHASEAIADMQVCSDSDMQSMPDDELRSVLGFETVDYDNLLNNEVSTSDHIVQDDNAFAERMSLSDHMDHICEEVSFFHSKLGDIESSIARINSSMPTFITNALKEQLLDLLSATLKDCLPSIIKDSLQTHTLGFLKRGKKKKDENAIPALTQGEHQIAENITTLKTQGELAFKESTMPLSKRFKIMHPIPSKPQPSVKQFTDQLFGTTSSKFSPSSLEEQPSPRDESKGKGIATEEPPRDKLASFQVEGGYNLKMLNIKSFITQRDFSLKKN
nr:hypothetical protein [Tanacetum cinerariifolium]